MQFAPVRSNSAWARSDGWHVDDWAEVAAEAEATAATSSDGSHSAQHTSTSANALDTTGVVAASSSSSPVAMCATTVMATAHAPMYNTDARTAAQVDRDDGSSSINRSSNTHHATNEHDCARTALPVASLWSFDKIVHDNVVTASTTTTATVAEHAGSTVTQHSMHTRNEAVDGDKSSSSSSSTHRHGSHTAKCGAGAEAVASSQPTRSVSFATSIDAHSEASNNNNSASAAPPAAAAVAVTVHKDSVATAMTTQTRSSRQDDDDWACRGCVRDDAAHRGSLHHRGNVDSDDSDDGDSAYKRHEHMLQHYHNNDDDDGGSSASPFYVELEHGGGVVALVHGGVERVHRRLMSVQRAIAHEAAQLRALRRRALLCGQEAYPPLHLDVPVAATTLTRVATTTTATTNAASSSSPLLLLHADGHGSVAEAARVDVHEDTDDDNDDDDDDRHSTRSHSDSVCGSDSNDDEARVIAPLTTSELDELAMRSRRLALLYQQRGRLLQRADVLLRRHAAATERWESNEDRRACYRCQRRFSALTRRHHCRRCGRLCCAECSRYFGKKQDTSYHPSTRLRYVMLLHDDDDNDDSDDGGDDDGGGDGGGHTSRHRRSSSSCVAGVRSRHPRRRRQCNRSDNDNDDDEEGDKGNDVADVNARATATSAAAVPLSQSSRCSFSSSASPSPPSPLSYSHAHERERSAHRGGSGDGRGPRCVVRTEYATRMTATDTGDMREELYDTYTYAASTRPALASPLLPLRMHATSSSNSNSGAVASAASAARRLPPSSSSSTCRRTSPRQASSRGSDNHDAPLRSVASLATATRAWGGDNTVNKDERDAGDGGNNRAAAAVTATTATTTPPQQHVWVRICGTCYHSCLRARKTDVLKRMKSANRSILDDGHYYFYVLTPEELHCVGTLVNKPDSLRKQVELQSTALLERSADYIAGVPGYGTRVLTTAAQQTPQVLRTLSSLSLYAARAARRAASDYVDSYRAARQGGSGRRRSGAAEEGDTAATAVVAPSVHADSCAPRRRRST